MSKKQAETHRRLRREEKLQALRDGRVNRAKTHTDKRKERDKYKCRGKVDW